jgi:type III secretion protein R
MFDPIKLLIISVLLTCVPLVLMGCTSYLKIHIVLSFIKNALGTQAVPGGLIVSFLSILMTLFILEPTVTKIIERAHHEQPAFDKVFSDVHEAKKIASVAMPYFEFLRAHTKPEAVLFFQGLRQRLLAYEGTLPIDDAQQLHAWAVMLPAFLLTELKDAFRMGVMLLLPFLLVDLIVCNTLAGLGMHMVNPLTIGLPLKLFLFFSADCWTLLIKALILSYQ